MGLSDNDVLVNAILCINVAATLAYLWIILSEKRKKAFFSAPVVIQKSFVVLFVGPLFISPIISQNKYEGNWVGNIMGALIILVGLSIIMMAFFKIGIFPSLRAKSSLATTGIYGVVRHPIYSGTIMMFAGLGLLFEASLPLSYSPTKNLHMNTSNLAKSFHAPVQQTERIQLVDILRGFALFGILLVNMLIFARPLQSIVLPANPAAPWYDQLAEWLIHFLVEGKFYSLFSLLFGLGLVLQMDRIEARGGRFIPLYARRLLILLGIGAIHAFLIWVGDILMIYAVLVFLLIFFRKAKPHTILIWVVIFLIIPLLFNAVATGLVEFGRSFPESAEQINQTFAHVEAGYVADVERAYHVYQNGNYAEITSQRMYDYLNFALFGNFFALGFNVLAMFLLGVYFGKRQIFHNPESNQLLFWKLLIWGVFLGLLGNGIYATLIMPLSRFESSWPLWLATVSQGIGAPMLCLAYISAVALLMDIPAWQERLRVLAPVGQMALTNYLFQSIVCTLIFYGYGLGLFGKVGPALGRGFTIVIYLIQIPISHWWMKRFRYGPAEWFWRSLTYWKIQPMKRTPTNTPILNQEYRA